MSHVIGVAGCGAWGVNIVRDLVALGATVVVADPDPARRSSARALGAFDAVETVDALVDLSSCAGYVVATPASEHRATCAALLERGVPVFVEKPAGGSLADVEALAVMGADRLFVMHKWRYHPGVLALADLARGGSLGSIRVLATTRTGPQPLPDDVDVVWHLAVHDVAIALEVLGIVPRVEQVAGTRDPEGRLRRVEAVLRAGEAEHRVVVAAEVPEYARGIRLEGSAGTAVLAQPDAPVEIVRADGTCERVVLADDLPLVRELAAFLAHCDGGPAPKSSMADALAIAECLAAIDAAA